MVGVLFWAEKARAWALELENGWVERRKAWVKKVNPYPFIKAVNIKRLPLALKLAYSPRVMQAARLDYPCQY